MSEASASRLGYWCGAALLMLAMYIGTYFVVSSREPIGSGYYGFVVLYSSNPDFDKSLTTVFWPAHELDARLIRPDFWEYDVQKAP